MLITFDEHGGLYDYIAPPSATPSTATAGADKAVLTFDRLGLRVPTIVVSAAKMP